MYMKKTRLTVILLILITLTFIQPTLGKAPEVLFSEAWFGTETQKIEVEPGDQGVQLVVRLVNAWNKTYRYAEGYIILPEGFTDAVTGESKTRLYTVESPTEGRYFYMKYLLNINKSVQPGEYMANMFVRYVFWDEENIKHAYVWIRFRVTGRVKLTPSLTLSEIRPAETSTLVLKLINGGSAVASSLEARVESLNEGLAILSGQGKHVLGDLAPGGLKEIPLTLLASRALADRVVGLKLSVDYLDPYGSSRHEDFTLYLKVKPLGEIGVVLDSYITQPILKPSKVNDLRVIIANKGVEKAESVDAVISIPSGVQPPITLIGGSMAVKLGDINPGEEKVIDLKVFVNPFAAGGAYVIPLKLTYVDDEGRHIEERSLTITIAEESKKDKLSIYCSEYVRGGMVEDVDIKVKNIAGENLRDITITISPEVDWVTLLGPTTWYIDSLENMKEQTLKLKMYVPSNIPSGSTIGEPFNLKVDVSFEDSSGIVRDEGHTLGMYVRGIIDIKLQEISVEKLGEAFYLTGRLLNEGTETALYTRVTVTGGAIHSSSLSYLGDLNPNAPLLFSIPIDRIDAALGSKAEVELKVTYMNSLREKGETLLKAQILIPAPTEAESQPASTTMFLPIEWIIIVIVAILVVAVAIYVWRRRRGSEVH